MRKTSLISLVLVLALLSVVSITAPSRAQGTKSIADLASTNKNLTMLTAAIKAAGLDSVMASGGPFTVFAPTDAAFTSALSVLGLNSDQFLANKSLVTNILLYHVVPGTFSAKTLLGANGALLATGLIGTSVRVGVTASTVSVNNAKVVTADIAASNGVIHVIDTVLLPNPAIKIVAPLKSGDKPVIGVASGDATSKTLVKAIAATPDIASYLGQDGPYTVFAPNDVAFTAAATALALTPDQLLGLSNLPDILTYHVVPFAYPAAALMQLDGAWLGTVLPDQHLTVSVKNGKVSINGANVVSADESASNGVIHGIDKVLLPVVKVAATPAP